MTKAEIINKIAEETGIAKKDVAATVEAFMEEIRVSLAENKENVYLRGFGTFMPNGKKKKGHKMATHKRKKRLRKNRHKSK